MKQIGCVVLAAGLSERFGSDKLAALFHGKSVLRRTLEVPPLPRLAAAVTVVRTAQAAALAEALGFQAVHNPSPEQGVSTSIRLGLKALPPCDGVIFQVADQPLLTRRSVERLIDAWEKAPDRIAALASGETRGNPCLFPARFFPALLALEGDMGGGTVIRRHPGKLLLVETAPEELADVDTAQTMEDLRKIKGTTGLFAFSPPPAEEMLENQGC